MAVCDIVSPVQMLRLCTEVGGTAHLVERSDCRKGLRWKSLEVATPSHFMADISAVGEAPASGFGCRVEERHPDGSIHTLCLSRFASSNLSMARRIHVLTDSVLLLQSLVVLCKMYVLAFHSPKRLAAGLGRPGRRRMQPSTTCCCCRGSSWTSSRS